jgi:translation initiation factor 2-alpha kinase 1
VGLSVVPIPHEAQKPCIQQERPTKKGKVKSRYDEDFIENEKLGRGGYGSVFKVQNKLDGLYYALKKIQFRNTSAQLLEKVLREVKTLALLNHPNIVRYHSAWLEEHDSSSLSSPLLVHEDNNLNNDNGHSENIRDAYKSKHDKKGDEFEATASEWSDEELNNNMSSDSMEQFNPFKLDDEVHVWPDMMDHVDPNVMRTQDNGTNTKREAARNIPAPSKSNKRKNSGMSVTTLFIVMQLYSTTLAQWLEARTDPAMVDPHQNIHIFKQICRGLQYIHSRGVIHRDLKPGNIFLSRVEDGASHCPGHGAGEFLVCLGDFGLAIQSGTTASPTQSPFHASSFIAPASPTLMLTLSDSASSSDSSSQAYPILVNSPSTTPTCLTTPPSPLARSWEMKKHTSAVGTLTYSSPEQRSKGIYNEKTDIFSLGIIFFELYYPCSTKMEKARVLADLRNRILPPHFLQKYPSESAFILWLMSPNPDDRPSVDEILRHDLLFDEYVLVPRNDLQELSQTVARQQQTIQQQQQYIEMLEQKLSLLNVMNNNLNSCANTSNNLNNNANVNINPAISTTGNMQID